MKLDHKKVYSTLERDVPVWFKNFKAVDVQQTHESFLASIGLQWKIMLNNLFWKSEKQLIYYKKNYCSDVPTILHRETSMNYNINT